MANEAVLIVGASGHAKVILAALLASGVEVLGLLDDDPKLLGTQVLGAPVLGPLSLLEQQPDSAVVLGIGDNATRRRLAARFPQARWLTVVHPRAWVHDSVVLGAGTVVFAGAIIQPECRIGQHAIVNTGATIDHDCVLGDFVHIAPGVNLSGGVCLGEGAFLGVGSCALPLSSVGEWSIVGGGGAVVGELPANVAAVGVPAKVMKTRAAGWHE